MGHHLTSHAKTILGVLMVFSRLQIRMCESLTHPCLIVKAAAYLVGHALTCTWQAIPVLIQLRQMAATTTTKCNTLIVPNLIVSTMHTMTTRELTPHVLSMTRVSLWHVLIVSRATRCCVLDPQRIHQCSVFAVQNSLWTTPQQRPHTPFLRSLFDRFISAGAMHLPFRPVRLCLRAGS